MIEVSVYTFIDISGPTWPRARVRSGRTRHADAMQIFSLHGGLTDVRNLLETLKWWRARRNSNS